MLAYAPFKEASVAISKGYVVVANAVSVTLLCCIWYLVTYCYRIDIYGAEKQYYQLKPSCDAQKRLIDKGYITARDQGTIYN